MQTAMRLLARQKHESENEVTIVPSDQGFQVICTIHDIDFDLMQISLYAPDEIQAEIIRQNFLKDPSGLYQSVIDRMTKQIE